MKRNVLQTLALSTVLVSTAIGVLGTTEAKATVIQNNFSSNASKVVASDTTSTKSTHETYKRDNLDGTYTLINVDTGEEEEVFTKEQSQSKSTEAYSQQGYYRTPVDGEGFIWTLPNKLTDLSQIKLEKNGVPYTGRYNVLYAFKDGVMQHDCWFQAPDGTWLYLDSAGIRVCNCYINGYYLDGNGHYDASKNDSSKGTQIDDTLPLGIPCSEFTKLLSQGKIKVYTEKHSMNGSAFCEVLKFTKSN